MRKGATLIRAVSAGGTTTSVTLSFRLRPRFRWSRLDLRKCSVHSRVGWERKKWEFAHTQKSEECTGIDTVRTERKGEMRESERERDSGRERRPQLRPPMVKPRRARQPAQTVFSNRIAYRLSNLREERQRDEVPLRALLLLYVLVLLV